MVAQTATTLPEEDRGSKPPQRQCSLPPTPFTWVGVGAHGLLTPPQAREPQ